MDLQIALERRAQVEEFRRKHRTGLLTLVFTDTVGTTKLKQDLGDLEAVSLILKHHAIVREVLSRFPEGEEISTAGDAFFIVFVRPSDAVKFGLLVQAKLRELANQAGVHLLDRIGVHIGEVVIEEREGTAKPKDLYGIQVDICARVMSLADGDQVLLTRGRRSEDGTYLERIDQVRRSVCDVRLVAKPRKRFGNSQRTVSPDPQQPDG